MLPGPWLVSFLLAILVSQALVTSSLVDEQVCADRAENECQCNFAEHVLHESVFPDDKMCKQLQECVTCLSFPRCQSRHLDRFRTLLLWTSELSRKAGVCPNLRYSALKGKQTCSKKSRVIFDQCGNQCQCHEGKLKDCVRVRREFTRMSLTERTRYVRTFYEATTNPLYKDDFEQLLNKHSLLPSKYLHHMPQIFLPWHRWYLIQIESFLKQIDCRVTIPYFQWTVQAGHIWRANPSDIWGSGLEGLGGNGVYPSQCVKDGIFQENNWFMPLNKGGGCLKRNFNYTCILPDEKYLNRTLSLKDFSEFEKQVRNTYHNDFHNCVGGLMHYHKTASNAPEFAIHHAFMDKIWDSWQRKSKENMFQYYPSENYRMPLADRYPWEYLNNEGLPADLRVMYQE